MKLVVPEAPAPAAQIEPTQRARQRGALRVGFLDNSKSNADHLFRFLAEGIRAAMPDVSIMSLRKPLPSIGAEPAVIEQLARETDLVVSAMAD
jgi:hypothetical protein